MLLLGLCGDPRPKAGLDFIGKLVGLGHLPGSRMSVSDPCTAVYEQFV